MKRRRAEHQSCREFERSQPLTLPALRESNLAMVGLNRASSQSSQRPNSTHPLPMRMLLDTFSQTLRTLWAHKLRSFLTMFGIAWGVGSLLLLIGVGEGFRNGNRKQLETFGKNIIFFFGGRAPAVEGSFHAMKWFNLTYDDYLAIRSESKLAINISPVIARDDIPGASDYTSTNRQVSRVPPIYSQRRTMPLQTARWHHG